MIRIDLAKNYNPNFVPTEAGESAPLTENQKNIEFIKRLLVLILIPFGLYAIELQIIPGKQAAVSRAQQQLQQVQQFNANSDNTRQSLKTLEEQIDKAEKQRISLNKIVTGRSDDLKIIYRLQDIFPERLWLNKLIIKEKELTINGGYLSQDDYDRFFISIVKLEEFVAEAIPTFHSKPSGLSPDIKEYEIRMDIFRKKPDITVLNEDIKN